MLTTHLTSEISTAYLLVYWALYDFKANSSLSSVIFCITFMKQTHFVDQQYQPYFLVYYLIQYLIFSVSI